jgi:hypothetical protein
MMKNKGLFILVLALLCVFPALSCLNSSAGGNAAPEVSLSVIE